ncbi:MAG: tetratricopeptide repeat protein [Clostridia bacterium]|nr:tetratricopeptide repeat protein [Clostridia bacterium]
MFKNFIFNLYGSLIDVKVDDVKEETWSKLVLFLAYNGANYEKEELKKSFFIESMYELGKNQSSKYPDLKMENVFHKLYTNKGLAIDEEKAIQAAKFFRVLTTEEIRLRPGVKEALELLKNSGKKIYIFANGQREFAVPELKYLDIYEYFDGVCFSSDIGICKPDEMLYRYFLSKEELDIRESVILSNDYTVDIEGASKAGVAPFYLGGIYNQSEACFLSKIRELLEGDSVMYEDPEYMIKRNQKLQKAETLAFEAGEKAVVGDYTDALKMWDEAIVLYNELNAIVEKSNILYAVGYVKALQGSNEEAYTLYNECLRLREQAGDLEGKATVLFELAGMKILHGQLQESFDCYAQSLAIREQLTDWLTSADTLHAMAYVKMLQGDIESPMAMYEKAIEYFERIDDFNGKAVVLHEMADLKVIKGELSEGIKLYEKSLEFFTKLNNTKAMADVIFGLGYAKAGCGQLDEANNLYRYAIHLYDIVGEIRCKASVFHKLATLAFANAMKGGEAEPTMELLKQDYELNDSIGDHGVKADILNAMAAIQIREGDKARAHELLIQALELYQLVEDEKGKANVLDAINTLNKEQSDEQKALELLEKGLDLIGKEDDLKNNITNRAMKAVEINKNYDFRMK